MQYVGEKIKEFPFQRNCVFVKLYKELYCIAQPLVN